MTKTGKTHDDSTDLEPMLTPKETADVLRVSVSWLAKARMRGDGPPYCKVAGVRYPKRELLLYVKSRLRRSTSES
jgi:hypothetical protein